MKPIVIHPRAQAEFEEGCAFYEGRRAGLGRELRIAVEETIGKIQQNPGLGGWYKSSGFRHVIVRRFRYVIYYVELADVIWVAAIAHGSRRPDYWRRRRLGRE